MENTRLGRNQNKIVIDIEAVFFGAYRCAPISVTIEGPLEYTLCAKLSNLNNSINYFELESGGI